MDEEMMPDLTPEQLQEKMEEMGVKNVSTEGAAQMIAMYNMVQRQSKELLAVELARIGKEIESKMTTLEYFDVDADMIGGWEQLTNEILLMTAQYCTQMFNSGFQHGMVFSKNLTIAGLQEQIKAAKERQKNVGRDPRSRS